MRRGACDDHSIASAALGPVEGLIGGLDQLLLGFSSLRNDCGAADGDGYDSGRVALVRQAAVANGLADVFGDSPGAVFVGSGQHDGELFSAVAGNQIAGAENDIERGLGDLLETAIAPDVSVGVVVSLEVVGVDQEQRELVAVTQSPQDGAF